MELIQLVPITVGVCHLTTSSVAKHLLGDKFKAGDEQANTKNLIDDKDRVISSFSYKEADKIVDDSVSTLDEIRDSYQFEVSCQKSVPQALEAFFESTSFEDAIRNAISIGGDSDTIACITGSIASAYYGIPDEIRNEVMDYLDTLQQTILLDFENKFEKRI